MTSDEATLARLMCAAQAGDALAYRQLLGMAAQLLMRWFRRKVAPTDLDDLVQDTLLAVHQRRASWDPARPFLPWLAAIARYRWVDRLRRARVRDADALFDDIAVESGEAALIGRLGFGCWRCCRGPKPLPFAPCRTRAGNRVGSNRRRCRWCTRVPWCPCPCRSLMAAGAPAW
jgi:hypothetical protein